jgi:hypothetical protein
VPLRAFDIKGTGFVIGVRIERSGEQGLLNLEVVFAKTFGFESKAPALDNTVVVVLASQ